MARPARPGGRGFRELYCYNFRMKTLITRTEAVFMSIGKGFFTRKALFLLTAAILLAAVPPLRLLRAETPAEAGPAGETAAMALNARDLDAPVPAAAIKDLEALVQEAAAGDGEEKLALEALNEVDVDADAEEKAFTGTIGAEAAEKERAAGDGGGKDQGRLERESERDTKEAGVIEKDAEGTVEQGEDDKGDTIEREDPGMDD